MSGGECEGEEQEDSSSSLQQQVLDVASEFDNLNVEDDDETQEPQVSK